MVPGAAPQTAVSQRLVAPGPGTRGGNRCARGHHAVPLCAAAETHPSGRHSLTHSRPLASEARRLLPGELAPSAMGLAAMAMVLLAAKGFGLPGILGTATTAGVGFGVFAGVAEIVRLRPTVNGGLVRPIFASVAKGVAGGMLFAWLVSL